MQKILLLCFLFILAQTVNAQVTDRSITADSTLNKNRRIFHINKSTRMQSNDFKFYYVQPDFSNQLFYAFPSETTCQDYQAFHSFFKVLDFDAFTPLDPEGNHIFWGAFGLRIMNSNESCGLVKTSSFPDQEKMIAMNYYAYFYSKSDVGTQIIDRFVKTNNPRKFFQSSLEFQAARAMICDWELFTAVKDTNYYNWSGGSYIKAHQSMSTVPQEFEELESFLNQYPRKQAFVKFMKKNGLKRLFFIYNLKTLKSVLKNLRL